MLKNIKISTVFVSTLVSIVVSLSLVQAMEQKDDSPGVIQPYRTSTLSSVTKGVTQSTSNYTQSQSPRPRHNKNTSNNTTHAEMRRKQRDISNQDIQTAKQIGKKEEHKNSITYTNEKIKLVSGKNGRVITVIDNKRNTNFD
ncbi:MAG: hypothetical protein K0M45_04735 [Candidatus Paracaedibacteraceae bacterium]|nr:hypothetical protein [Candidatus Paracaedibacteraceae bacterium]